jgi:hypothetical protein
VSNASTAGSGHQATLRLGGRKWLIHWLLFDVDPLSIIGMRSRVV